MACFSAKYNLLSMSVILPIFHLSLSHAITVQTTVYLKGALLLAAPLYLQVAFVHVPGYSTDCFVVQLLLGLPLLLSLPAFMLFDCFPALFN